MPDLLVELFCEEIPARMQRQGAENFKKMLTNKLVDAGLIYEAARCYWTPRRLTLDLRGLTSASHARHEIRKGPAINAPQAAIAGFLRASGLNDISEAEIVQDAKKAAHYVAKIVHPGRQAQAVIAEVMPQIIRNFPWPKSMRWGTASETSEALRWIRPLHAILCLFGSEQNGTEVIDFSVGTLRSGNVTYGHRFMGGGCAPIVIRRFEDYVAKLEAAHVILDGDQRKEMILSDARNLAFASGLELVEDEALLEEVSGLVEWPQVLMGEFDETFLTIPPEIIRLTIRTNQKCFVTRKRGETERLSNHFILVSNITARDGGREVVKGNERVVRARLADALYFWQVDGQDLLDLATLKPMVEKFGLEAHKPLDQRMARLAKLDVTFHAKLGTQGARVERMVAMAALIAPLVGANLARTRRASLLAKADLQSEIVGEFPELQGVMGRYYALRQGEEEAVAAAIEEHYKPQGASDGLPRAPVSIALALADKIDTLAGFWLIDEKPTGSKDPYALRRAALGVIRLLLSRDWHIALIPLFIAALENYKAQAIRPDADSHAVAADLLQFFHERLKVHLREEGARHDAIDAVLTHQADDLLQIARRIEALIAFINGDEGENLLIGTKRAANILDAEAKKNTAIAVTIMPALFTTPQEELLFTALEQTEARMDGLVGGSDFSTALTVLAALRAPIDAFFEHVLVNDERQEIRANRLALLKKIHNLTSRVADFSKLVVS